MKRLPLYLSSLFVFSATSLEETGVHNAYFGAKPLLEEEEKIHHVFYQWVALFLMMQVTIGD
jgi:hypothetical protein